MSSSNYFVKSTNYESLHMWQTLCFLSLSATNKLADYLIAAETLKLLDFKLSLCNKCWILSFGWCPGICLLCAVISEHTACAIFIGDVDKENQEIFLSTPPTKTEHTECSEKTAHKSQMRGGITHKKDYNTNSSSTTQQVPCLLCNLKIYLCVYNMLHWYLIWAIRIDTFWLL